MQRRSRRDACSSLGRGAEQHHGQHDRGPGDCGLNACSHVAHSFHRRTRHRAAASLARVNVVYRSSFHRVRTNTRRVPRLALPPRSEREKGFSVGKSEHSGLNKEVRR